MHVLTFPAWSVKSTAIKLIFERLNAFSLRDAVLYEIVGFERCREDAVRGVGA